MLKIFYVLGCSLCFLLTSFSATNLLAQASNSKNTVIDDLLSTYDVCEGLGYSSDLETKQKIVTLNSEIKNLTSQLNAALDEIERLKKSSKSGSSKVVDNSLEIELLTNENNFLKDELKSLLSSAGLSSDAIDLYQKLREQVVSCNNSQIELKKELDMLSPERELDNRLKEALFALEVANSEITLQKQSIEKLETGEKQILAELDTANLALAAALSRGDNLAQEINALKNRNPNEELIKAKRQIDVLNLQLSEVRKQLYELDALLTLSEERELESKEQLRNVGSRLNQALASLASEERKRRKLEEVERQKLENDKSELENELRETKEKLVSSIATSLTQKQEIDQLKLEIENSTLPKTGRNKSKYLVEYKRSIQKLLNDKSCDAGIEDGIFGRKTLNAAQQFSRIIRYNFDPTKIYEKDFYSRLLTSTAKCNSSNVKNYIGSWSIVSKCTKGTVTATADIVPLGSVSSNYLVKNYINNFGERASGYAEEFKDFFIIKLDFEERDFSDEARLYKISDRLLRGTSPNCNVEATKN